MKLLLLLFLAVTEVLSRSGGPPLAGNFDRICTRMTPNHGGTAARSGNGGYTITTTIPRSLSTGYSYTAGQTYTGRMIYTQFLSRVNIKSVRIRIKPQFLLNATSDLERYKLLSWFSGDRSRPRPEQCAAGNIQSTKWKPAKPAV